VLLGQDVRAAEAQAIPLAVQTTHVQELRRFFRASGRFDFAHTADDLGHLGVQPVGGDIVNVAGVSMARAVYQGPGCKVVCRHFRAGLLRLPGGGREIGGSRVFTIDGITVRIHDDGKVICCMASDMPPEEFLRDLLGQARARPVVGVAPKG